MKDKKLFRVICCLLAIMLTLTGNSYVKAEEITNVDMKLYISEDMEDVELVPGTTQHVRIPVKSREYIIPNTIADVIVKNSKDETLKDFKIKNIKQTKGSINDNEITSGMATNIEFDVTVPDTAVIGRYYFSVTISAMDLGTIFRPSTVVLPCYVKTELQPAELDVTAFKYKAEKAVVGNNLDLDIYIKNAGQTKALNATVSLEFPVNASGEKEIIPKYPTTKVKLGDLKPGASTLVTLPVQISKKAVAGTKNVIVKFEWKDDNGNRSDSSSEVYIDVTTNEEAPQLIFSDITYKGELLVGNDFKVIASLENIGESTASSVEVSVTEGVAADSIRPSYSTGYIDVDDIAKSKTKKVTIPLSISKDATKGTKAITICVKYKDDSGVEYTQKTVIYPEVEANEEIKKDGTPNIVITNVDQSPVVPYAGEQVTIAFDVANKGTVDVSEFKIGATNLTAETFSPVSSDPYIYVDKLAAGASKRISMTFDVSKSIAEGYNSIPVTYTFKYGDAGTEGTSTSNISVLNVVNETGDLSKSVPKLIISDFSTDLKDLRAGQVFQFNYEIKNTHSSVAAKNIKVSITQADNIFSVTSGSNSSYIDIIEPNTAKSYSIELKVKSDATTKAYPLVITMQYEYDGAQPSPTTGKVGEEVQETINLVAVENSRPDVQDPYIDAWDMVMVGQPVLLNFQFINKGKSPLNNVYATISGDFQKSLGTEQYIGTVSAGDSQPVEMEVIPLAAGDVTGTITIHYEDSNGDEQTMTSEFTSYVTEDMPMDFGPDFEPMAPVATPKKRILPIWLFVIVQVGIFVIITPTVRAIIIKRYKKKLEKREEDV